MSDYESLRAAATAATPGPWGALLAVGITAVVTGQPEGCYDHMTHIAKVSERASWNGETQEWDMEERERHEADARYIALASPDRILDLLDELEITPERMAAALAVINRGHHTPEDAAEHWHEYLSDAVALLAALRAPEPKEGV